MIGRVLMFWKKSGNKVVAHERAEFTKVLRDFSESIIVTILLAVLIRECFISAYRIPTAAMVPNLKVGDYIFALRSPFGIPIPFSRSKLNQGRLPYRGEVVVFKCPDNKDINCVKRVIGLPGDSIQIKSGVVYVNDLIAPQIEYEGKELIQDLPGAEYYQLKLEKFESTSFLILKSNNESVQGSSFGPFVVPQGQIFVLGDNRDSSDDSRIWGAIPISDIQAKAWFIWLSLDWQKSWNSGQLPSIRWKRIFTSVQ